MKKLALPGRVAAASHAAVPAPLLSSSTAAQAALRRGELWAVDFEPQSHCEEPGKVGRPALVLQADSLNGAHHASTIVIPGASQTKAPRAQAAAEDANALFPLRVRVLADRQSGLRQTTDLLIDQVRAVSNRRFMKRLGVVDAATLARAEHALRWLTCG